MDLNSKKTNAHYDMVHGAPAALERDKDGSHLVRWGIEAEYGIPDGGEEEVQTGWQCHEIRLWCQPTRENIKKAIIRHYVDECGEFSVVNGYNKHVLGIKTDDSAVAEYVEFLQFTEQVSVWIEGMLN